jgi:hypothetical protein
MLMEKQNFHVAKKGKRNIVAIGRATSFLPPTYLLEPGSAVFVVEDVVLKKIAVVEDHGD